jgi:hypothetical protein
MKSIRTSITAVTFTVVLLAAMCPCALGQDAGGSRVGDYKVDFAVPDMPAFKALGAEPDNLLRPTDPKALALMLADQTATFRVIPQSFAAEFAPGRLFGPKNLTMSEYSDNQFWYDTRVSLGSKRNDDSTGGSVLAVGIRSTVINGVSFASHVVDLRSAVVDAAMYSFAERHAQPADKADRARWDAELKTYVDSVASDNVDKRIGKLRDEYHDNWNRGALDAALAIAGASPDSFTSGLSPSKYLAWASWATPIGAWGQLVAGANGSYAKPDSVWAWNYSVAGRLVGGINEFKLDFDGQFKHDGAARQDVWLLGLGAEAMVFSGGWVEFRLDWENNITGGGTRLVPGLKYRFTMPKNFTTF